MSLENYRAEEGKLLKDDLEFYQQSQIPAGESLGANEILDPGFEDYWVYNDWLINDWNAQGDPDLYTKVRRTEDCRLGKYAMEIHYEGNESEPAQNYENLTEGRQYLISAYGKLGVGCTGFTIEAYNGAGKYWRFTGANAGTFQTGKDSDSVKNVPAPADWEELPTVSELITADSAEFVQLIINEYGGSETTHYVKVDFVQFIDQETDVDLAVNGLFDNWTGVALTATNSRWQFARLDGSGGYSFAGNQDPAYVNSGSISGCLTAEENTLMGLGQAVDIDCSDDLPRRIVVNACRHTSFADSNGGVVIVDNFASPAYYYDYDDEAWTATPEGLPPSTGVSMMSLTASMDEFVIGDIPASPTGTMNVVIITGGTGITFSKIYVDDISCKPISDQVFVPALFGKFKVNTALANLTSADTLLYAEDSAGKIPFKVYYDSNRTTVTVGNNISGGGAPIELKGGDANIDLGGGVGGYAMLRAGANASSGGYINGSDVYLVPGYTNFNGTNRDGRVYVSSNAGWNQPALQMWQGPYGGMISAYHDYAGTEQPLYLMGAPAYPGSNNNGKTLHLSAGGGDGTGEDGRIYFGKMTRDDISYYTEEVWMDMQYNADDAEVLLRIPALADSSGRGLIIASSPAKDSSTNLRNGGNAFLASGGGVNGGENGIAGLLVGVGEETGPLAGLAFVYTDNKLYWGAIGKDQFGGADYAGEQFIITGMNADQASESDLNGGDVLIKGGLKVNDGVNGHVILGANNSAPTLTENGTLSFSLDETLNTLVVTVKYSNGTSKGGTVALT